jgi:hypothetical protein
MELLTKMQHKQKMVTVTDKRVTLLDIVGNPKKKKKKAFEK